MSLQGTIGEEKELMSLLQERQSKDVRTSRSSSVASNVRKSSVFTSRSNSLTNSVREAQSYPECITFNDPSSRLATVSLNDEDIDVSSEERMTDDECELSFGDEGRILPNYSVADTPEINSKKVNEIAMSNERNLMRKADSAKIADSLLASERAISNAKAIGQSVPQGVIKDLEKRAQEAGTEIHVDPEEFYQERSARKSKLEEYALYKKKLITSGSNPNSEFVAPYTQDEENKIDAELASVLNSKTKISDIDSDVSNQRATRSITRDESRYALEWCIGTVLVNSSVLYILNVLEDDEYSSMNLNGIQPSQVKPADSKHQSRTSRERTRVNNVNEITHYVVDLLKLTKLQVHVVIESCHHPIPRHFIVGVIKHMSPTLVIVGSKGTSAIKGVLMGSLSNHLVRKSTSPVMVVRHRLKKLTKKSKFINNVTSLRGLADAKID